GSPALQSGHGVPCSSAPDPRLRHCLARGAGARTTRGRGRFGVPVRGRPTAHPRRDGKPPQSGGHPMNQGTHGATSAGSAFATFLDGVRILDLSQYIPGPLATLLLADMGAEVMKIEPPRGDEMRNLGPRDALGRPIFYNSLNAGKTIRHLNLKDDADRSE